MARSTNNLGNVKKTFQENEPEAVARATRSKKLIGGQQVAPGHRKPLGFKNGTQTYQRRTRQVFQERNPDDMEVDEVAAPVVEVPAVQEYPVIPEGVPDVDKIDRENPQLCAEYAPFIYAYLRQQEAKMPIRRDFLKGCHVNGKMRAILLDWLIEVHLQFKLLQETLYLTVFMIDRFLQQEGMTIKRKELQLVGVTAMFTASKVEEMYAPEITDFIYITDNATLRRRFNRWN